MKTLSELSKELKIPYQTLATAAQDGRINARKSGATWLVAEDEQLREFLEKYSGRGTKK